MRGYLIGGVIGVLIGLSVPAGAQIANQIYGVTSTGTIVPVLVDSAGRLQVVVITP